MRTRQTLTTALIVVGLATGALGLGLCGQALAQAGAQPGQNGAAGNNGAGQPNGAAGVNGAAPANGAAPYGAKRAPLAGPYTGGKAGFYESQQWGQPAQAANNAPGAPKPPQKWQPQPYQFKSMYPPADPNNPGAEDADGMATTDQAVQEVAGHDKDSLEDTTHSLTYFVPKEYYWCHGEDPDSANVYYSDIVVENQSEFAHTDDLKFNDFLRGKYRIYAQKTECRFAEDIYQARTDADHSRSADQMKSKTVINTLWNGNILP